MSTLSPWLFLDHLAPALPPQCFPQDDFLTRLSSAFHICVPTHQAFVSTLLGSLSILAWLFAQLPQIYKNYKLQSTAGLSIYFLVEWCLGDTTNLVGCILTKQATWQIIVASYYTAVDCVLVFQYVYYTHYVRPRRARPLPSSGRLDGEDDGDRSIDEILARDTDSEYSPSRDDFKPGSPLPAGRARDPSFNPFHYPGFSSSPREKASPGSSSPRYIRANRSGNSPMPSPRTMLLISMLCAVLCNASPVPMPGSFQMISSSESNHELLGRLVSWSSTLMYLGSRLPQLYKNHIRRSTSGLSPTLFIAAFFGNLFYSTSLLTNPLAWSSYPPYGGGGWAGPEGSDRMAWVKLAAPFFLGAAGVLALDGAVGLQFLAFGEGQQPKKVVPVKDERGRRHWREVSGWMRGWVPSPSPSLRRYGPGRRPLLSTSEGSGQGATNYGSL